LILRGVGRGMTWWPNSSGARCGRSQTQPGNVAEEAPAQNRPSENALPKRGQAAPGTAAMPPPDSPCPARGGAGPLRRKQLENGDSHPFSMGSEPEIGDCPSFRNRSTVRNARPGVPQDRRLRSPTPPLACLPRPSPLRQPQTGWANVYCFGMPSPNAVTTCDVLFPPFLARIHPTEGPSPSRRSPQPDGRDTAGSVCVVPLFG